MCGRRHLIFLTWLATWPLTDASGSGGFCQSEDPSKAPSLLSLKADVSKVVDGMESMENMENREHNFNGTVCSNCSNSTNSTNHSLEDLIKTVLEDDMNQSNGMPDPVVEDADGTDGSLGKNLEFLYLKVVSRFQVPARFDLCTQSLFQTAGRILCIRVCLSILNILTKM